MARAVRRVRQLVGRAGGRCGAGTHTGRCKPVCTTIWSRLPRGQQTSQGACARLLQLPAAARPAAASGSSGPVLPPRHPARPPRHPAITPHLEAGGLVPAERLLTPLHLGAVHSLVLPLAARPLQLLAGRGRLLRLLLGLLVCRRHGAALGRCAPAVVWWPTGRCCRCSGAFVEEQIERAGAARIAFTRCSARRQAALRTERRTFRRGPASWQLMPSAWATASC